MNLQYTAFIHDDDYTIFDEDMAREIVEWLHKNKEELDLLIVHCDAGVSRSGGVAKWAALVLDLPFDDSYPDYNEHVYRTLVKVGGWGKFSKESI